MKDVNETKDLAETQESKASDKMINTFDDVENLDNVENPRTFNDVRELPAGQAVETFDDLRVKHHAERVENSIGHSEKISLDSTTEEVDLSENISNSSGQISFNGGRHRAFFAIKEGVENVPVKLTDVYENEEGLVTDQKEIVHCSIDQDVMQSGDIQNLMDEHDFQGWLEGEVQHKGYLYGDYAEEFDRLSECQRFLNEGHAPEEIATELGDKHASTYSRFYETDPIEVNRVLETDKLD